MPIVSVVARITNFISHCCNIKAEKATEAAAFADDDDVFHLVLYCIPEATD